MKIRKEMNRILNEDNERKVSHQDDREDSPPGTPINMEFICIFEHTPMIL